MLTMAFKRIINIGKGFEGIYEVNPAIFEHKSEERLWKTFQLVKGEIKREIDREHYLEALDVMSRLSEPINEFFSEVMVMTEDKLLKENRLAILKYLHQQFLQLADFSKLSI